MRDGTVISNYRAIGPSTGLHLLARERKKHKQHNTRDTRSGCKDKSVSGIGRVASAINMIPLNAESHSSELTI